MSLTTVVKQRRIRGQKAAEGQYIDLLDDVDDIERLLEAYLSLRDEEHTPGEKPDPLTTEVFKDYVRRIHDAIRSTDEAVDAFNTAKDGTLRKSPVMNYVDSVGMFEAQLIAGKLVKTVHRVQSGTISLPSWPVLTGLKLHMYKTFEDRMDKVLRTLETRKAVCKALFFEEVSMVKRVSMQPEEEAGKKGSNKTSNTKRSNQVVFAKDNMPKDEEADTATPGTGDREEGADHENTDKDMAPPPTKKTRRAPRTRTPASEAVTINPGARRGKKPTATPSAEEDIDDSASIQPDTPAASTPSNTGAGSSSQPAFSSAAQPSHNTGISFTPINAGPSNQRASAAASASNNTGRPVNTAPSAPSSPMQIDGPNQSATPGAVRYGVPKQTDVIACPVVVDHGPAMQAAIAALPRGKGELYDPNKFPGALGKSLVKYGGQRSRAAGPSVNELPPAYSPGPYSLPQQPQNVQSRGQYLPRQYQSPGNYFTDPTAFYGYQQSSQQGYSLPQANQQFRMQESQRSIAQVPPQGQLSQHDRGSAIQLNGPAPRLHHVGQAAGFQHSDQAPGLQPNGRVANFQQNGRVASIQQHGRMASIQRNGRVAGIRQSGTNSCSIVNNYFHRPEPESPTSQALAKTRGRDSEYMSYEPDPKNNQVIGFPKILGDDEREFPFHEYVNVSTLPACCFLDGILTTVSARPRYSDAHSAELVRSAYSCRRR